MAKKIVVLLADGFEETEAIVPADVWRRVGFEVVLVGVDSLKVRGGHDIYVEAECLLSEVKVDQIDCLFLPGGIPGATNLKSNADVLSLIRSVNSTGIVSALCAAPIALAEAGIIANKSITCYPGFEDQLGKIKYTGSLTEVDGNIITGKGPGAVFEFAKQVAIALNKESEVIKILKGMIV